MKNILSVKNRYKKILGSPKLNGNEPVNAVLLLAPPLCWEEPGYEVLSTMQYGGYFECFHFLLPPK